MEFWGVEVPSGKPLTCKPGADSYVHVSQAALGDNKPAKGNDRVVLKVKVGSNEVVVGTLSQGKCDQTTLDLIFEKDFVLSHNSSGSVFFCGYKTDAVKDDVSGSSDEDDEEFDGSEDDFEEDAPELVQLAVKENGKLGVKAGKSEAQANKPTAKLPAKSPASKVEVPVVEAKPKAKHEELAKGGIEKSDDDDEDDEDEDEDDDDDDDVLGSGSDDEDMDSDEEGDSDDEDEEEEPKSAGKKRPLPTGKPELPGKKSKIATPGKPDLKSPSVPASTPKQQQSAKKEIPAKKTPGKENAATPASGKKLGQHYCEPCKKNFNSESALSQHKTAKHK